MPAIDSHIINAVKENNIYVPQVQDKKKKKVSERQPLETNVRLKVLQDFQDNSNQDKERKQLQKICDSSNNNVSKKHEKMQQKMDHIKRKKLMSVTMPSKNHVTTLLNNRTSLVPSPTKDKLTSNKTSEVFNTSPNLFMPAFDYNDALQDTQASPSLMRKNNLVNKQSTSSCLSQNSLRSASCSLVQANTFGASLEKHNSTSNSEADQNKIHSTLHNVEKEVQLQVEPHFLNFKDKGIYLVL